MSIKVGSRVVDQRGDVGIIVDFRQHLYSNSAQQAKIEFDNQLSDFPYRNVANLHELKGKESLLEVLNELYQKTATEYENARHGGSDHGQYVYGAQLDILKIIAARVLDEKLPLSGK